MTLTVEELLDRNDSYAASHQPLPTFKDLAEAGAEITKLAIVSCCDPRIIPEKYFNLATGEAIVWRNIAGHPQACYKDIAALDAFLGGFKQLIIVHHTDCGSTMWSDEEIRVGLQKQFPTQHSELSGMNFGAVLTSIEQSVKDDLNWLKTAPLMRKELADKAVGFVYDIKSGRLERVQT